MITVMNEIPHPFDIFWTHVVLHLFYMYSTMYSHDLLFFLWRLIFSNLQTAHTVFELGFDVSACLLAHSHAPQTYFRALFACESASSPPPRICYSSSTALASSTNQAVHIRSTHRKVPHPPR